MRIPFRVATPLVALLELPKLNSTKSKNAESKGVKKRLSMKSKSIQDTTILALAIFKSLQKK